MKTRQNYKNIKIHSNEKHVLKEENYKGKGDALCVECICIKMTKGSVCPFRSAYSCWKQSVPVLGMGDRKVIGKNLQVVHWYLLWVLHELKLTLFLLTSSDLFSETKFPNSLPQRAWICSPTSCSSREGLARGGDLRPECGGRGSVSAAQTGDPVPTVWVYLPPPFLRRGISGLTHSALINIQRGVLANFLSPRWPVLPTRIHIGTYGKTYSYLNSHY